MQNHLRTELIVSALRMAVGQRWPKDVIHRSDQGCRCTSLAFGRRCREAAFDHQWALSATPEPALGLDQGDNPMAERFFSTLECELLSRRSFAWATRVRRLVKDYEGYASTLAGLHLVAFACLMPRKLALLAASS